MTINQIMDFRYNYYPILSVLIHLMNVRDADGLGCNWGTQSTHPLPPNIVVRLMKDNGFTEVKLFEAEPGPLKALGNSGIQVMVGIPNNFLAPLAANVGAAEDWVSRNVSDFISTLGVDIRYVAVGNEPFLKAYSNVYLQTTLPALKNIQAALIKAGLSRQVKVTVPLNADVYETPTGLPSGGKFRPDIHPFVVDILKFLSDNAAPLTINIYPFLSLYADPDFPFDYAFFTGSRRPLVDGPISYTNVFDANFDSLVWALEKNGLANLSIIVGEVGWPTDGDKNANPNNARRFNQAMLDRINSGKGTPKRPVPFQAYVFSLVDEDAKSLAPGNFERHWGLFKYDGTVKYRLSLSARQSLVPAKGVRYLERRWCVMAPVSGKQSQVDRDVSYACGHADCTRLGVGSSCGNMDSRDNASYAFNAYYQTMDQREGSCEFSNMSAITKVDPLMNGCGFEIMIDLRKREGKSPSNAVCTAGSGLKVMALAAVMVFSIFLC